MSISNIFDIITQPMMNRQFPELSGEADKSNGFSFADFLGTADTAGQWADITGPVLSDSINSALLELQEQGDITDIKGLWEEMSEGQSLDDMLMKRSDYVFASITTSIKFGETGDSSAQFGSSDNDYDMIFGTAFRQTQNLLQGIGTKSNDGENRMAELEKMQMSMLYRFRSVL